MPAEHPPTLYVVSDGRGQTSASVLQAALVQFHGQRYAIVREANVRTVERVEEIVDAAARTHGVVVYTLVAGETRRAMRQAAASRAVPIVDVLGPALSALHDLFKRDPQAEPGLLYASEREGFDRHEAIDYTLKHDDGRRPDGLPRADVVLVGVSRSGKSATCFYLAYQGVKAANVPLVPCKIAAGAAGARGAAKGARDRTLGQSGTGDRDARGASTPHGRRHARRLHRPRAGAAGGARRPPHHVLAGLAHDRRVLHGRRGNCARRHAPLRSARAQPRLNAPGSTLACSSSPTATKPCAPPHAAPGMPPGRKTRSGRSCATRTTAPRRRPLACPPAGR